MAIAVDSLVPAGSTWSYLDDGSDQGIAWRAPEFDDSAWARGPAQLGYGDGDEATVLDFGPDPAHKHITTYFRHVFELADASAYSRLVLKLLRDDGAVVYLNGTEIFRSNMPSTPVLYETRAIYPLGPSRENEWVKSIIDSAPLIDGPNLLAVEIHQYSPTSSDISFDLVLLAEQASVVEFAWSGALTTTSIRVNARTLADSTAVRLYVSENRDMSASFVSACHTADLAANNRVVSIPMDGLSPGTPYYYAVEVDGILDVMMQGRFTTTVDGPQSFTFAFASCANTGSATVVFETIRDLDPLFFLHTGDFHYEDIGVNDVALYRDAYDTVLASPTQSDLYRSAPIVYIWDDHDYGLDDSDMCLPGREAARLTYQEYVPHYPLPAGCGDVPIYQAFTIGRIRFIVTDLRSERTPFTEPDNPDKSMLGRPQKEWFKNELLAANGAYPLIVWVNTIPWIGTGGHEDWSRYTYERREIADFVKDNGIEGLFMVSGDAHMLAIDDGTNSDYATGGGAPIPLMHAAALDQTPHVKGGPYSEGAYPGSAQFGLMTITDDGVSPICIQWSGRNWENHEIVAWGTCSGAPVPDTDSDGVDDLADCAIDDPQTWAAPEPVNALRVVAQPGTTDVLIEWPSQSSSAGTSTNYDIVHGSLQALRSAGDFGEASCLVNDHPDLPCLDTNAPPAPGQGEYCLLRGVNPCGSSGYGWGGAAGPRIDLDGDLPCAMP